MATETLSGLLGKCVRYGQIYLIYPGAFEAEASKMDGYMPPQGLTIENIELTTSDKVTLRCYFLPAGQRGLTEKKYRRYTRTEPRATVIMFHGNGYHIWHHVHAGKEFVKLGCNVLLVSYRGYGLSDGLPSEKGLRKDAQAGLDYVLNDSILSQFPIILHGHSLGGAVAIDLAYRNCGIPTPTLTSTRSKSSLNLNLFTSCSSDTNCASRPSSPTHAETTETASPNPKIAALIVENSFLSIPHVARTLPLFKHVPSFFIHQKWESYKKIGDVACETGILMMSGEKDCVVSKDEMKGLWDIASGRAAVPEGEPRQLKDMFISFKDGSHADTWIQPGYWEKIDAYLTSIGLGVPSSSANASTTL